MNAEAPAPGAATGIPFTPQPVMEVAAPDGVRIAVFEALAPGPGARTGRGGPPRPPLLLVHGATGDHTAFRVVGPMFAASRRIFAMDRRGRGASGDAPSYAIEREFEDVAAVSEAIVREAAVVREAGSAAGSAAGSVDVLGHSYGARCALGAALRSDRIRRVVAYEGAPLPPGVSYRPEGLIARIREWLDAGDPTAALETFLAGVVGMTPEALQRYRAEPVWPLRVAAAHTILREIDAEVAPAASLEVLAAIRIPVLLVLGSLSLAPFRIGTEALAARLPDAHVAVIEGAAHAAHHTHPDEFTRITAAFLDS